VEIGFTLAPDEQSRGYATEALTALLDHVLGPMRLHRVIAITDARNTAAAALLARVGMRQEAHFVENVFFKGAWGSELLFAKLAREHQPAPRPPTTTCPPPHPHKSRGENQMITVEHVTKTYGAFTAVDAGIQIFTERFGQAIFGTHVLAGDLAKGVGWVINLAVAELVIRPSVAGRRSGARS